MFSKVLVSDDLGSINQGVLTVLDGLGIKNYNQVQYCDDAHLKVKRAILDKEPIELLITDLSFKSDHRAQNIDSGEELVKILKTESPELKIIVYSVEDRLQKVRTLIKDYGADAYVCKGRRGLIELSKAVNSVYNNQLYLSPQVEQAISSKQDLEITDYDIALLKQLSKGELQDGISNYFKSNNIYPSSLSSIEKRLNKLRIQFKAQNGTHLVSIVKDLGLI